jgi:hypothetical protein
VEATQQFEDNPLRQFLSQNLNDPAIKNFRANEAFRKLPMKFDSDELRRAHDEVLKVVSYDGLGVNAICLNQIPGNESSYTGGNLRGIYWTRPDSTYEEVQREDYIDEIRYSQFVPAFEHTYFKHVFGEMSKVMTLGRMRLLKTKPRTTLSWHRDPEPRIHIPIITNPGAIMIINNHCTHMPADGSVYFTDTRGYHTAVNGGEEERVHLVIAVPLAAQ